MKQGLVICINAISIRGLSNLWVPCDNNDNLAYWLSNTASLLLLLQRTLKASGAARMAQQLRCSSVSLFGRTAQSFRGIPRGVDISSIDSEVNNGSDNRPSSNTEANYLSTIEAKYPALLFKQQLTAYVEKIYGMIRDNLKKEISPQLGLCIQVPRIVSSITTPADNKTLFVHWKEIVQSLNNYLNMMKANYVASFRPTSPHEEDT